MQQAFRQFGPVKVEWPGKGKVNTDEGAPKGYVYLVLEKEGAVPALLSQVLLSNYEKKLTILASSALWTTLEESLSQIGTQKIILKSLLKFQLGFYLMKLEAIV